MDWLGLVKGKLFGEAPRYVDVTKPAGMTEIPKPTVASWLWSAPSVLLTSPNGVWAGISMAVYWAFPYSMTVAAVSPLSLGFFAERLPIWMGLVLGYTAFWHGSLYLFGMGTRPFVQGRVYSLDKLFHNMAWTTSGIVIWTGFENVVCYLWATGRLAYVSDWDSFTTPLGFLKLVVALMGVPVWRSVHFYFAHRFLHYGPIYQQVHSLHHRNTDVEPFSGLCMHPVEHLYYFACIFPNLVFVCSPFAFVWNGVHLLLSPAASHSGYEDHFQSDAFHYLHHRYFECNYAGTDAAFMDVFFGTFKGTFVEENPKPREDAKSSLRLLPTTEFVGYLAGSAACVASGVPVVVGFGPVVLATLLALYGSGRGVQPVKMGVLANLLHLAMGTLFCSVPIAYMSWLLHQS
jgi:sterol desaturase/sphingolipid hydroxylase (fatty acid hydroxylase superfamily)